MLRFWLQTHTKSSYALPSCLFARKQPTPQNIRRRQLIEEDIVDEEGSGSEDNQDTFQEDTDIDQKRKDKSTRGANGELVITKKELILNLPKTSFNPRFSPARNEEKYHPQMATGLYRWQQQHKTNSAKSFVIHDLPFQTYGEPHLGHFYNKSQQDIAARFALLTGCRVTHQIGFNLHGQAIQNSALLQERNRLKQLKHFTPEETRQISKDYANSSLASIAMKMARWGLMTDFSQAYTTSNKAYEAGVVEAFAELVSEKSIYLEEKPTLWSVKGRCGLDDDEASMDMIPVQGTFVKFEVSSFGKNLFLEQLAKEKGMKVFVVGFTTELWTLNNLKALSVNENIQYGIYAFDNALHVISRQRYKNHRLFFREHDAVLQATQTGNQISALTVKDACFEIEVPILPCDQYAKNEHFGSGITCICPGHYSRHFEISEKYSLSRNAHVDQFGRFDENVPQHLINLKITNGEADEAIYSTYADLGLLLDIAENYETECYKDKKTGEKLIVRTQLNVYSRLPEFEREYFVDTMKEKKVMIQNEINKSAEDSSAFGTLEQTILDKSDNMTISISQDWGIPIPIFFYKGSHGQKWLLDEITVKHVAKLYEKQGSSIWFDLPIQDLLPPKHKKLASQLEKGQFVFDQWFESGCSWFVMLKNKLDAVDNNSNSSALPRDEQGLPVEQTQDQKQLRDSKYPCDLVIQGKDQIDSWLLSTSLLSVGLKEGPFFSKLKLHRVVPATGDEKLSKLSEFKGSIDDLIEGTVKLNGQRQYGYGVDVLRMWVALSDRVRQETKDGSQKRISGKSAQKANERNTLAQDFAESSDYLFLRPNEFDLSNTYINTIRKCLWNLLGTLKNYTQDASIMQGNFQKENKKLSFLNEFMMTQLVLFSVNVRNAYAQLEFALAADLILDFVKHWVYDFYLDATKKEIIANPLSQSSLQALFIYSKIVDYLLLSIAPILPHNAEDIYSNIKFKQLQQSVFHQEWPETTLSEVQSLRDKIPTHNFLWEMRACIWDQLRFQMERYNNIREKEKYDIAIVVQDIFGPGLQVLEDCRDELEPFICAGNVKVHTAKENEEYPFKSISTFKFKGDLAGNKIEYIIKIYLSEHFKCVRCLKFTALSPNTVCPLCIGYLSSHHKSECSHLLTKLSKNPNLLISVRDAPALE